MVIESTHAERLLVGGLIASILVFGFAVLDSALAIDGTYLGTSAKVFAWFGGLYMVVVLFLAAVDLSKNRSIENKVQWALVMVVFTYFGALAYLWYVKVKPRATALKD